MIRGFDSIDHQPWTNIMLIVLIVGTYFCYSDPAIRNTDKESASA